MTVPKSRRSLSRVEFFYRAYRMNDEITKFLIRDFGIKRISKDLKAFTYCAKMTEQDRNDFMGLCNKYNINVESEFPLWLVEYYRDWVLMILRDLINNITQANTIYPKTVNEFYLRRKYQYNAIANCYQLKQVFQTAVRNLPTQTEKYMRYVEMIDEEIELLKNWRKSDNKILEKLQNT